MSEKDPKSLTVFSTVGSPFRECLTEEDPDRPRWEGDALQRIELDRGSAEGSRTVEIYGVIHSSGTLPQGIQAGPVTLIRSEEAMRKWWVWGEAEDVAALEWDALDRQAVSETRRIMREPIPEPQERALPQAPEWAVALGKGKAC